MILAAGGIVERWTATGPVLAIIHRPRYRGEWNLPKGKLNEGEQPLLAALREVKEETGCSAIVTGFGGVGHYYHESNPKVVFYWRMKAEDECQFRPSEEVDRMEWLSPEAAWQRLTHDEEKRIVSKIYRTGERGVDNERLPSRYKKLWFQLFGSPQYDRLASALDEYEIRLQHRINWQPLESSWQRSAAECLSRAKDALRRFQYDCGWQNLHTAQTIEVWGYSAGEVESARNVLCEEATKLSGWRKETIQKLVCGNDKRDTDVARTELYQAMSVRSELFSTIYHKIRVRGRSLKVAFFTLTLLIILIPLLARAGMFWIDWKTIVVVELTGIFGAALSVASSLTRSSVDTSIPQQVLASVVTWMRPAIGAGAALAAYLLFKAGALPFIKESEFSAFVITFIAGFSERFIIGAVEKILPNSSS